MAYRRTLNDPVSAVAGALKIGAIVVGGLYVIKQGKNWLDKQKAESDLVKDQASTILPGKGKKLFDLNGKPIASANLGVIASDLENALSYPVDSKRAVRVFRSTPFGYVKQLEKLYLEKYSEPLKERMLSRLSDADWISVKFNFR